MSIFNVCFSLLLLMVAWWVWTCRRLFEHARAHHEDLYEEMGRPDMSYRGKPTHTVRLFMFLYGGLGEGIEDARLTRLRARMRVVGILYPAGFTALLVAALLGLIDVPD